MQFIYYKCLTKSLADRTPRPTRPRTYDVLMSQTLNCLTQTYGASSDCSHIWLDFITQSNVKSQTTSTWLLQQQIILFSVYTTRVLVLYMEKLNRRETYMTLDNCRSNEDAQPCCCSLRYAIAGINGCRKTRVLIVQISCFRAQCKWSKLCIWGSSWRSWR